MIKEVIRFSMISMDLSNSVRLFSQTVVCLHHAAKLHIPPCNSLHSDLSDFDMANHM